MSDEVGWPMEVYGAPFAASVLLCPEYVDDLTAYLASL